MIAFNNVRFTYNKEQLLLLQECMFINADLSSALIVFFDTAKLSPDCAETLNWLRHAEQIKSDPRYIEQKFLEASGVLKVS